MTPAACQRNLSLVVTLRVIMMALFPIAIITLFWKHDLGLSMTQIMMIQAVLSGSIAIFEFPAGYVSDRIGYGFSLKIGYGVTTVGWIIYIFADQFWSVMLGGLVQGLGIVFVSGADQAIMYESLKSNNRLHLYSKWNSRYVGWGQMAEGAAALSAGVLYSYWDRLPFLVEVLLFGVGFCLCFFLIEPERADKPEGKHLHEIKLAIREVFVGNHMLMWVLALSCLFGLASYYPVWLVQLYTREGGISIELLGPIWAVANFIVAIGAFISPKLACKKGFPLLWACCLMVMIGFAGLSWYSGDVGFLFYYFICLMRGLNQPMLVHKVQNLASSRYRSSILSLRSLAIRGTFLLTGPILGIWVDHQGYQGGFALLGLVFTPLLALLIYIYWHVDKRESA